jgi:hypothetical protein
MVVVNLSTFSSDRSAGEYRPQRRKMAFVFNERKLPHTHSDISLALPQVSLDVPFPSKLALCDAIQDSCQTGKRKIPQRACDPAQVRSHEVSVLSETTVSGGYTTTVPLSSSAAMFSRGSSQRRVSGAPAVAPLASSAQVFAGGASGNAAPTRMRGPAPPPPVARPAAGGGSGASLLD